ncbi:MAG TPA: membrane protein insertase YidC [Rhodothermales bacterium]|nr:membrane protein insertase YidC [Rhodothermales bacterium]
MDRNVAIATVLIAVIMFAWLWLLSPRNGEGPTQQEQPVLDTTAAVEQEQENNQPTRSILQAPPSDSLLAGVQEGEERTIVVQTDLYTAVLSSKGATFKSFVLKKYKEFDQKTPVQLVDSAAHGALSLAFTTPGNRVVDTRALYFTPGFQGDTLRIEGEPASLSFTTAIAGGMLRQTYTFKPGEYEIGLAVQQSGPTFMTSEGYEVDWNGGLSYTEGDPEREANATGAYARSGGEIESVTLQKEAEEEQRLAGVVDWTAVKNKYFTAVVIPSRKTRGAELIGVRGANYEETYNEVYTTRLLMGPAAADTFRLYLGPMDFYRISKYDLGLYGMVDYGWDTLEWITRPLAEFIFIPVFNFLGSFIHNFGLVIIIFALLIKIVLYPLTKTSYVSMARMRELQPKMEAIKEKYADDSQKQQQAIIQMYKETGVSPFGGCMPMLLQYPVLIALWQFLPSSLAIRQQSFLWAHDLSAPDAILHLPFTIPLYGNYVAGFTLLMGLSLIVQMRLQAQPSTNPQAKMFTYMMPAMLFLFFNRYAAGLSLYYLVYNVASAVQQKFINDRLQEKHGIEITKAGTVTKEKSKAPAARKRKSPKKART